MSEYSPTGSSFDARRKRIEVVNERLLTILARVHIATTEGTVPGLEVVERDLEAKLAVSLDFARGDLDQERTKRKQLEMTTQIVDYLDEEVHTKDKLVLIDLAYGRKDNWLHDVDPVLFRRIRQTVFVLFGVSPDVEPLRVQEDHDNQAATYSYAVTESGVIIHETIDGVWSEGAFTPSETRDYYNLTVTPLGQQ